jgi:hypothetical protein
MRYIDITQFGEPDVLQLAEGEIPEPGEGDVLVKVAAAHRLMESSVHIGKIVLLVGAHR